MTKYATAPTCEQSCPCRTVQTDPNCPCGFVRCDRGPYCEVERLAKRAVASSTTKDGPGLSESDALIAAFDKMRDWHREEAARRAVPEPKAPAPKVRSKKQRKLDKADSIASVTGPDWLREEDPLLESILTEMRREDT